MSDLAWQLCSVCKHEYLKVQHVCNKKHLPQGYMLVVEPGKRILSPEEQLVRKTLYQMIRDSRIVEVLPGWFKLR